MKSTIAVVFLLITSAWAQVRPYITVGASINGSGYSTFSGNGSAGIDAETTHLIGNTYLNYNVARKTHDGEVSNLKGHVISVDTRECVKLKSYLLGAGVEWTKTITTDYTKEGYFPMVGGGRDFENFRIVVMYMREHNEIVHYPTPESFTAPGEKSVYTSYTCNCSNGVQGFSTQFWYPSPTLHRHLFFYANLSTVWFHSTLTDPNSTYLTNLQKKNKDYGGSLLYAAMWRF